MKKNIFLFLVAFLSCCVLRAQTAALPAVVDVSAIGAATYTVPIEVVPGGGGLQPSLAVTYNSLGGQGIMGWKWNLQGVSAITRVPQSNYYDGSVKAICFDTSDRFALDGKRLLLLRGDSYQANGAVYAFENEDFSRIRKVDDGAGGFYFVDTLADGRIAYYGQTTASRQIAEGKTLAWMLCRVVDADGNEMTYTYATAIGEHTYDTYKRNGGTYLVRRYFSADCESEGPNLLLTSRRLDYIYADGRVVAVHVRNITAGTDSIYYIHTDHLGSWERVVDASGHTVQSSHFDPWGNRMAYADWNQPDTATDFLFPRGFTGHAHYDRFRLINAGARLYDPFSANFLSPDPYVQEPFSTQSLNRYSYCRNNPVMFTDPDGEFWNIIIGAVIGGAVNLGMKAYKGQIHSVGDGLAAFFVGATAGAVGAWTGGAALAAFGTGIGAGGFVGGFTSGMVGSAFSSPMLAWGNTAYFGDPELTPGQYALDVAAGGLLGGAGNGLAASMNGNSFWTGKPRAVAVPAPTAGNTTSTATVSEQELSQQQNNLSLKSSEPTYTVEIDIHAEKKMDLYIWGSISRTT